MQYRQLGETGVLVSEVSPRTWAFGSEIYDRHVRLEVHHLQ